MLKGPCKHWILIINRGVYKQRCSIPERIMEMNVNEERETRPLDLSLNPVCRIILISTNDTHKGMLYMTESNANQWCNKYKERKQCSDMQERNVKCDHHSRTDGRLNVIFRDITTMTFREWEQKISLEDIWLVERVTSHNLHLSKVTAERSGRPRTAVSKIQTTTYGWDEKWRMSVFLNTWTWWGPKKKIHEYILRWNICTSIYTRAHMCTHTHRHISAHEHKHTCAHAHTHTHRRLCISTLPPKKLTLYDL